MRSPSEAILDGHRQPPRVGPRPGRRPGDPPDPRPACTATRSRRSSGRRSCPGCRPAGCSPWPPGSSSNASASGCAFVAADYWGIEGNFEKGAARRPTRRRAGPSRSGQRWSGSTTAGSPSGATSKPATGRDQERCPPARRGRRSRLWPTGSSSADFAVTRTEEKPYRRSPYPPFMTSTLQQEAGRKLRLSSASRHAASPSGCTRTATSPTCAPTPRRCRRRRSSAARQQARELYGDAYVPAEPRRYAKKVKNAQEAHEAIRPPATLPYARAAGAQLSADEFRLYELIWKRTVASQMADAVGHEPVGASGAARRRAARSPSSPPSGKIDHLPRLPAGLRRGLRRPRRRARVDRAPAAGTRPSAQDSSPAAWSRRAHHLSAGPLHRGERWSARWRNSASAGRRRTPRSCRPSRTAATSGRRVPRSCPPSSPSLSSACWSSTSRAWSTMASPPPMEDDLDDIATGNGDACRLADPLLLRRG